MEVINSIAVWCLPIFLIFISTAVNSDKNSYIQDFIVVLALFLASIFAAIRFETGDDWSGYEYYYNSIDVESGLVDGYFKNVLMVQFEPGYYFIAYGLRLIDASYSAVNAISVTSLFIALMFSVRRLSVKPYFVVLIFLGLPLISLFYNQVRQSFAIAFVLFALQARSKKFFFILLTISLLFQFSVVVFVVVAVMSRFYKKLAYVIFNYGMFFMPFLALIIWLKILNPYEFLKIFIPDNLIFKIELYQEEETSVGVLRFFGVGYLMMVAYLIFNKFKNINKFQDLDSDFVIVALLSALLIPYSLLFFPNSYAFFGRILVFALIMLSFSGSILYKNIGSRQGCLLPLYGLGLLSNLYCAVTLYIYSGVYFPYKSII